MLVLPWFINWIFFSEDELEPFVSGNILCHRSYFKNQDPGTDKRLSKIWINGVLVIEQRTFIKESDGMELLNVVFFQKWEATGMPIFILTLKLKKILMGKLNRKKSYQWFGTNLVIRYRQQMVLKLIRRLI